MSWQTELNDCYQLRALTEQLPLLPEYMLHSLCRRPYQEHENLGGDIELRNDNDPHDLDEYHRQFWQLDVPPSQ